MATRQQTARQKEEIEKALREGLRNGTFAPGTSVPSLREIAGRYGVSSYIAHQVLQSLAQEGTLESTRGRGTFVGHSGRTLPKRCVFVVDAGAGPAHHVGMQMGFEDRIAQLGGMSGISNWAQLLDSPSQIAGAFQLTRSRYDAQFAEGGLLAGVARVRFADKLALPSVGFDQVSFDDFGGALGATNALLRLGYRRIAFLGLHSPEHPQTHWGWSRERQRGWAHALSENAVPEQGMSFHPAKEPSSEHFIETARRLSQSLLQKMRLQDELFAVLAANDGAAIGLMQALESAGTRRELWPAIVGFDNSVEGGQRGLSSLRLPWEEVGRAAADLLWERASGSNEEPFRHLQIAMRFLNRSTCPPAKPNSIRCDAPPASPLSMRKRTKSEALA